ncbi:MAG TPA: hypothetical protein PLM96_08910 [Methanoregulaceae archaeon]|jgi:hypothetical protein|nr:hypothetical protein [Methanoregulaceae archaeon]HOP67769.1 hypothetical protein [Methanoregulaceae archaeon]HPJ75045.1 hypothetical protein [Methanoregulaceae archaeon]HPQ76746.1 hypothetical protein [Methanoregulaceae archaeon]HQC11766.1 hypothetical protein [Methanoregulaceae archaeon]
MFLTPDFVRDNEEWIIWLLGSEFHEKASFQALVQRTRLLDEQVEEAVRNLERVKEVRVEREAGSIVSVSLLPGGIELFESLRIKSGTPE